MKERHSCYEFKAKNSITIIITITCININNHKYRHSNPFRIFLMNNWIEEKNFNRIFYSKENIIKNLIIILFVINFYISKHYSKFLLFFL